MDRYKIKVRTTSSTEEYTAKTRSEADELFKTLVRWDAPPERLYVEMQDSGREKAEFKAIKWCFLNEELEKASKVSQARLDETLKRITQGAIAR